MSIPKYELNKSTPLDSKTASGFFGSEDSYFGLLERYEEVSLLSDLKTLAKAVDDLDYLEVRNRIHSIKGASAYAGASRVTDHCYWMQYYYEEGDNQKMMDLYPALIASLVEFRVYYRKVIAERKKQPYTINPEHETWDHGKKYRIIKIKDYEYQWEKIEDDEENEKIEQLDAESDSKYKSFTSPEDKKEDQFTTTRPLNEQSEENSDKNQKGSGVLNQQKSDQTKVGNTNANNDSQMVSVNVLSSPLQKGAQTSPEAYIGVGIPVRDEEPNFSNENSKVMLTEEKDKQKETMGKNKNTGSHPILKIESEAVQNTGAFWGCSKWTIF